jgi:ATP-dependent Clp protease protease subunit
MLDMDLVNDSPIRLLLFSSGGDTDCMWPIIDTMNWISSPVHTFAIGCCESAAACIFANGEKRFMLPNSFIMLHHQTLAITEEDRDQRVLDTLTKHFHEDTAKWIKLIANLTKKTDKSIRALLDQGDKRFYPQEAIDFGLADYIVVKSASQLLKRRRRKPRK